MKKVTFFAVCVLALFENVYDVEGKVFTKCGLTKELLNNGFERSFVGNWVCLIESESSKNTSKVTNKANGSTSYGLFQINDREWCKLGKAGGKCKKKCEDFTDDDIKDDSICAKYIQAELGFRNWEGWIRGCYGRTLPFPPC